MEKHRLRVLSYNIHKGFTVRNRRFVLESIREAIRKVHPDLVFLQEVLGQHDTWREKHGKNWPDEPQFEYLADSLWPHFAYGKNAVYNSGHHGNAILSKFPFTFWENIDISTNRYEKRGLLHGVIELPCKSKPLHAICVHLGLFETERRVQVERICDRIESHVPHGEPLVIGGDFNDWMVRASAPLQAKLEVYEAYYSMHNRYARTYPSWMPILKLDRLYARGLKIREAKTLHGEPWHQLSDHVGLYAEFGFF